MVAAMKNFKNIKHIRCAAHTIQISVRKGIEKINSLVTRISNLNKFLVNHDKYHEKLIKIQQNNSIELIILDSYDNIDNNDNNNAEELDSLLLDEAEWIAINEIIKILEKFANATKLLSGSYYPTLSFTYPIICELFKHL
ncbi:3269_t:CDS:2, partial [Scutellospora calospora]